MKGDGRAQRAAARGEVGGDHAKDCCGQDDPWRRCPHDGGVIMQKAKNDRRDHDPDKSVQAQRCQLALQISAKDQLLCTDLNEQEGQGDGQQDEPLNKWEVWHEGFAVICDSSRARGYKE